MPQIKRSGTQRAAALKQSQAIKININLTISFATLANGFFFFFFFVVGRGGGATRIRNVNVARLQIVATAAADTPGGIQSAKKKEVYMCVYTERSLLT